MAKNKKPRKSRNRYNPNPLFTLAVLQRNSTEAFTRDKLDALMLHVLSAMCAIEHGQGTEEDILQLALASNISLILCEAEIGSEYIFQVKDAQHAITEMHERFLSTGKVGLTGPGIIELRAMLDLHGQQMAHEDCTEGKMVQALREIQYRHQSGVLKALA